MRVRVRIKVILRVNFKVRVRVRYLGTPGICLDAGGSVHRALCRSLPG